MGLSGDAAFSVGLLSGVAELVGQSPADIVRQLPLAEEVGAALVEGAGRLGHVLTVVRDYENGDAEGVAGVLDPVAAVNAYLTAVKWCNETMAAAAPLESGPRGGGVEELSRHAVSGLPGKGFDRS
jgi:EAL and modified HD-GYP domain-containing signal transduction protein